MEAESRKITQNCNRQFYDLINSKKRFKVHQGGTRSGKTFAACQYLTYLLTTSKEPLVISIIRKTLPALKGSVLRDFILILQQTGLYFEGTHNKADNTFIYGQHTVEFLSVDEPQKIRGRKRNIAFLNEANELNIEDFRQINMRTTDFLIMDFNPSDPVHWIYDEIIPRDDCDTWITTYKDNKFLSEDLVFEIERMRERYPDYWRVYGEGQKAVYSARQIFSNWNFLPYDEFPEFDPAAEAVIGLDFGFSNDESAATLIFKKNDKLFIHELLYKKGMTNSDLVEYFKKLGYEDVLFYADAAEPKSIEQIKRDGLLIKPAIKGQGSINAGISLLKEFDIYVSKESKNIIKEYNNYYWEELKDGTIVNKPKDKFNHAMDSIRYGVYSQYGKKQNFFVI
ncbi:MAG: PBSX family phage terminase large subunit [Flavobacteriales bacterium]|nr:PBSX family phage terminase large subunit [Flavobacteriales bacterium]